MSFFISMKTFVYSILSTILPFQNLSWPSFLVSIGKHQYQPIEMGRFSRCPYLSSVAVAFVAVTMPSFSVTPISVTVTLSTRRPVTIPAKRTEPRDAHIEGQNRKNVGDFTTFHNLTYRDVLGICTDLCPSVFVSLETKIESWRFHCLL